MEDADREPIAALIASGIDGLLHVSEIALHHVKHPQEVLKPGDEIEVIYRPKMPENAKPVSERNFIWPITFGVMVIIGVIWLGNAWRLASQGRLA